MAGVEPCLVSDPGAKALTMGGASHDNGSSHGATTPLFLHQFWAIPITCRHPPMAPKNNARV
jgi:hypothetical protein